MLSEKDEDVPTLPGNTFKEVTNVNQTVDHFVKNVIEATNCNNGIVDLKKLLDI